MLKPLDKNEKAFIFEFKVLDSDENEITLEDTLANAHIQIVESVSVTGIYGAGRCI